MKAAITDRLDTMYSQLVPILEIKKKLYRQQKIQADGGTQTSYVICSCVGKYALTHMSQSPDYAK